MFFMAKGTYLPTYPYPSPTLHSNYAKQVNEYGVSLRTQSECRKIRTRIIPGTFHAMELCSL